MKKKNQILCTCKNCGKQYDKIEARRIYGKDSIAVLLNYCSALCYTEANTSKQIAQFTI